MARAAAEMLDLRDTQVLKGVGIAAIALHNYFHWLVPVTENEFGYDPAHLQGFLHYAADPRTFIQALFAYFGHFGVQLFIFLSAYGLAAKYWEPRAGWAGFVWSRMCKLYPAFGAAVVLWAALTLLFDGLTGGAAILRREALSVVLTALGVQTLVPGFDLPPVGPWWFLPFILQFYCLWPAIRWVTRRRGALGLWTLAGVGVAATFLLQPALARWDVALMETPLGHLPEICLGIAAARFGFAPGRWTALCSTGAFIVGNVYGPAWLLTFPAVTVLMLWSYGFVRRQVREWPLARQFGDISMPLFFVNGILRRPFLGVAQAFGAWYAGLIFGVLSLLFSAGAASLMQRRERGTRERAAAVQGATL